MTARIKKGDSVIVVAGKEKNKKGKVLKFVSDNKRVIIEGVNLISKHAKPSQQSPNGGIVKKEGSINLTNVMLFCANCQKGVRVGSKAVQDDKVRTCRACGEEIK